MKKIVLISVLKPIDDTRIFEKFALTLSKKYHISIIGYPTQNQLDNYSNIQFYPLPIFQRTSLRRLVIWINIIKLLCKIKPNLMIAHAVELLPLCIIYRFYTLFECKLISDIRENYPKNFWYQNIYPAPQKYLMSFFIRCLEIFTKPFVSYYILAEKSYHQEFSFHKPHYEILENKFAQNFFPNKSRNKPDDKIRFLFSGTISETFGALQALKFIKKLYQVNPNVELIYIGKFTSQKLYQYIVNCSQKYHYVILKSDENLVPHQRIIDQMLQTDFAILPYLPNPSTQNCIPTKMYECLALKIPMIIQENSLWEMVCNQYPAGIFIDFNNNFNPSVFFKTLENMNFYAIQEPQDCFWEGKKLENLVQKLIFV